jgi:hypothetical protein
VIGPSGSPSAARDFEDCAKVVEFLATDLSNCGALIRIDGGLVRE